MRVDFRQMIDERKRPKNELYSAARFFAVVLLVVFAVIILFTVILGGVRVDGVSMEPTLHDGDYLFVNKLADAKRGDIVVVYTGRENAEFVIKRVVALGGDQIYAADGVLYRKCAGETTRLLRNRRLCRFRTERFFIWETIATKVTIAARTGRSPKNMCGAWLPAGLWR